MHASSSSLNLAVSHAVAFLIRPLAAHRSLATINKLQLVLEANLIAHFAPTWNPTDPLSGTGRRCLTLSPNTLPPRAIHSACIAANVDWSSWMSSLSSREFYLFVDPGCVSYRLGQKGQPDSKLITIWADEIPSPMANRSAQLYSGSHKTLAQQLLEADQEQDEEIFAMIDQARSPKYLSKLDTTYRAPKRSTSPLSSISNHSRSSSGSSMSSLSYGTNDSSSSQYQSRRERARQTRIFVDSSKTEVTPYDGGKTTVLTGGVMLGGTPVASSPSRHARHSSNNWRIGRD